MKAEDLRKSILQLAIQGKLVPQDPNDEPASVLLERIRIEKQKLIKEGKIKKDKGDSTIFKGDDNRHYEKTISEVKNITDEIPFDIPDSWCWVRLYDIVFIETGKKDANFGDASGKYNFYTCAMEPIKAKSYSYDGDYLILPGNGANVGMSIHYIGKFEAYQRTYLLSKKTNDISFPYLQIILNAYWKDYNKDKQYGSAIPYIKLGNLENFLVPMTSYKEQERIVAEIEKFEPLIAEYDKLEQQATKLDNEIYDNLKKSILQYAIQGKLVPQDPNDEPASVLLARIRAEKKAQLGKKYVESYIYKGDDNCYYEKVGKNEPVKLEDLPFDIPDTWSWARLKDIVYNNGQKTPTSDFSYVDIGSIDNKRQKLSAIENIISADKAPSRARKIIKFGDILYSTVRPYLHNMCIIDKAFSCEPIASTGFAVLSCEKGIHNLFLFYYMLSPIFDFYVNSTENSKGVAYPAINDDRLYKALIPIPPQAEQERICLKIKKMLQCIEKDES